ncbi:MAG: hypothetical protein IPM57_02400 [Oligoflexia bacterium]|nr:hypothetical protein [Oligoflexia bacterium]
MANSFIIFTLFIFSFSYGLPQKIISQKTNELIFWNVGQGDLATYIDTTNCLFFDVGGNQKLSPFLIQYIKKNCYLKENYLFISHYDFDHIQHYQEINRLVHLKKVFTPHINPKTRSGKKFIEYFNKNNTPFYIVRGFSEFKFNELKIKNIPHKSDSSENSKSLILHLDLVDKKILLTGDIPSKFEPKTVSVFDILKVSHHGSKYSTSDKFLTKVRPKICIISVGNNKYGHPHLEIIKKLRKYNCAVLETNKLGSIKLNF